MGDKPDHDFAQISDSLGAPPASASLRPYVVEVLDQGRLGSCVAQSGFQAVRISHVHQLRHNPHAPLATDVPEIGSRLFGYYLARAVHHMSAFDSGTHLRTFFEVLNKFGFCPESVWPYDDDKSVARPAFMRMPPTRAFRAAFDQRSPTHYRRIYGTGAAKIDEVKHAISLGHAVVFGIDVDRDFVDGRFDPTVPLDPTRSSVVGGHAMTVVGYSGDTFDICNSWGTDFGDDGFFAASADFIVESRDDWAVESAPHYSGGG